MEAIDTLRYVKHDRCFSSIPLSNPPVSAHSLGRLASYKQRAGIEEGHCLQHTVSFGIQNTSRL